MATVDAKNIFSAQSVTVLDLFNAAGEGFYVPEYQREFTWELENIDQLMGDICAGAAKLEDDATAVNFLGTILLVRVEDHTRLSATDKRAIPPTVRLVVDGQQRLTTLGLVAMNLEAQIGDTLTLVPEVDDWKPLREAANAIVSKLRLLYSVDLLRGDPSVKPKIIRAGEDQWTYDGGDDHYQSDLGRYAASFIRNKTVPEPEPGRVKRVIAGINSWIMDIKASHMPESALNGLFPAGASLKNPSLQEILIGYEDEAMGELLAKPPETQFGPDHSPWALAQLLLAAAYMLDRCCVTRLEPSSEDWGFDMFQALNTTGTPLTALETFLPVVMQSEVIANNIWEESPSAEAMSRIDECFEDVQTNERKNTLTNDLLGALGLVYEGTKLPNKFSAQSHWLIRQYREAPNLDQKRVFVGHLASVADFFDAAWMLRRTTVPDEIPGLEQHPQKELASLLMTYLREANSKLSAPILAAYYEPVGGADAAASEFVKAVCACAAFYTLWRSALGTAGLDDVYRRFMQGADAPVKVGPHCVVNRQGAFTADALMAYFREVLTQKGLGSKALWKVRAERDLAYDNHVKVCRFALFLADHDTLPDDQNPGLMKIGNEGCNPILTLKYWKSTEMRTVEHIAPLNPVQGSVWDQALYAEGHVNSVGNLTLLSEDLNHLAANRDWGAKRLYYAHVGERDPEKIAALQATAGNRGITLSSKVKKKLQRASFNHHVESLLVLPDDFDWGAQFVRARSERIADIVWSRLAPWIGLDANS